MSFRYLILSAVLLLPSAAISQELSAVSMKIERAVKAAGPGVRLERKFSVRNQTGYRWKAGEDSVVMSVVDLGTPTKAREHFTLLKNAIESGIPDTVTVAGSEAYRWTSRTGRTTLAVRKGSYVVTVKASNLTVAEQFSIRACSAISN